MTDIPDQTTDALMQEQQVLARTINSLTDQIGLFEMVQDLSQKIISQFDLTHILDTFAGIIQEITGFESAAIYLFDSHGEFNEIFSTGLEARSIHKLLPENSIIDWVMAQGRWTLLTDPQEADNEKVFSILPIGTPKKKSGFMALVTDPEQSIYNQKRISILSFVASQTAIAIENQDLYAQMNKSSLFLGNIVESISNGILVTDMIGNVTLINKNATALLGIRTKDIRGKNYKDLLETKMADEVERIYRQIRTKGFVVESMVSHVPYKEVHISIGITASLLTDPDNQTIGIIFIFRDMSASKEIERLTRLDAMKSEFVSNVSHELRTPLSIIKSYTEAILDQVDPEDHETRQQFLQVIDDQTDNLTTIVSNLLDLSRIEAGKYDIEYKAFTFRDLVSNVIKGFSKKLKTQDLYVNMDKSLPEMTADEDRIKEVLVNLIDNAIKFSPEGGIINIEAVHKNDAIYCSISDTGIGIPEDQLPRIFEKFYRVDNSDTYEIEGTGLGLSIVRHIINIHGGKIYAQSKYGKGSVFTFSLPVKRGFDGV
ncbi:MAG: PAS domain-containing protein [Desulfobacteraceae bacterium]|nr:MAG: PAS domain-containing protein [Desulfobacteraceae bacterium]